ncbi:MAG: 16S rRNA (uracil(1498)-N(3))-methyltransferase [Clostridia bacterium]|nr:16S rRNA (uracil(1498)-N(3))-methyltransferase [Clostridia bacterium]
MHRFLVPGRLAVGQFVVFPPGAARQMVRVLRLGPGECVVAVDAAGVHCLVELLDVSRRGVTGRVLDRTEPATEAPCRVELFQALLRGDKMDWVVQKATELGVAAVLAVCAERSQVRLDGDGGGHRLRRWRTIAVEAAEQCGRRRVPEVSGPLAWPEALARAGACELRLLCQEGDGVPPLRAALAGAGTATSVAVLSGPFGGCRPGARAAAAAAGFVAVGLGPRTLRAETAAVAAVTLVLYELADLGGR